jgi:hypothetical protein
MKIPRSIFGLLAFIFLPALANGAAGFDSAQMAENLESMAHKLEISLAATRPPSRYST